MDIVTQAIERASHDAFDLHYVARAGLLPELSRQTYDSLWKAIREAVLNAVDASATRIDLDFSQAIRSGEILIADNGSGMSAEEFREQFMGLGGSSKFGERSRYGRIGIGSLALLQYGESAVIETKRAGTQTMTVAHVRHSWDLGRRERREDLSHLRAGEAVTATYRGSVEDHFTRIRVLGVSDEVAAIGTDANAFYAMVERLRRALPLAIDDGRLMQALSADAPDLVDLLREHSAEWSSSVFVHSAWERDIALTRRTFGDDPSGSEEWSGPVVPIMKELRVPGDSPRRRITVAGYLLNQRRAAAAWMGVTARVQNVAVEEHTFFDVTADPGFRKYISGELWILGDIDRERLINIDRASFNRECRDYEVVQRFMAKAIVDFKSTSVQKPQRAKVAVRRLIEERRAAIEAVNKVVAAASSMYDGRGLPASEGTRPTPVQHETLGHLLRGAGATVDVSDEIGSPRALYQLDLTGDGSAVAVRLHPALEHPQALAGGVAYAIRWCRTGPESPPVVIRNRPRQIFINLDHGSTTGSGSCGKIEMSLALELAYLLAGRDPEVAVYDLMMAFLEVL